MVSAQFVEKYCNLCLLSLCEILVCWEFEFGVFLFGVTELATALKTLSHDAVFLATCNAVLLLRDVN